MSSNIPRGRVELLTWLEGIQADWSDNFAAIGITSAQVTNLSGNIANTRSAFTTVESIRTQSKAKTAEFYTKADDLRIEANGLVSTIEAFAKTSGNAAAVYLAANLSAKDPPSPVPAPEQPTNGNAELGGNGAVIVNFEARGAAGTVWQVYRQLGTETVYSFVGSADSLTKSFVDNTVPAGESSAQYTIQGVRGNVKGPVSFAILVQFGGVSGAEDVAEAA